MSQITMQISITLLSDAIFSSGMSVPGGEDIGVVQEAGGWPFIPGSTMKGLLRESTRDLLAWIGREDETLWALFGREGWDGLAGDRRILFTDLCLREKPSDPSLCYCSRYSTAIEDEIAKAGSLRSTLCIRSGSVFTGSLTCDGADEEFLTDALSCIKWAGLSRSRGFGRVKAEKISVQSRPSLVTIPQGRCITYRLHSELPLILTDESRSQGYEYETQPLIPGSAIRGMILSLFSQKEPEWFESHRVQLLRDVRFLDALPAAGNGGIPAIQGFYEDKEESHFTSVVVNGDFVPGDKRAKIGSFCNIEGDTLRYWSPQIGSITRIQRNLESGKDSTPFRVRYLCRDQDFEGYILLKDTIDLPDTLRQLPSKVWLGADRQAGFGKCSLEFLPDAPVPLRHSLWGYGSDQPMGEVLYLLALSPFTMVNPLGEPCGIDCQVLAEKLGVSTVELSFCSTSLGSQGGYNRTWQCRVPEVQMYQRGSLFRLICDRPPLQERISAIQQEGLGIRRSEGYGEVLFLRKELLEGIRKKKELLATEALAVADTATARRCAVYTWIQENASRLRACELSASQLGTVQTLIVKAIAHNGNTRELELYLQNTQNRGPAIAQKYAGLRNLLKEILETPLDKTLDCDVEDSMVNRLELADRLIDHSRKGADRK